MGLLTAGVVVTVTVAATLPGSSPRTLKPSLTSADYFAKQNVADAFARSVRNGLGRANIGGTWAATPATNFSVSSGRAHVVQIRPGHSIHAMLRSTAMLQETLQARIVLPAVPSKGTGTYFGLELRRQAGGASYRARVQILPGGRMRLSFTKATGGALRAFGSTKPLGTRAKAGRQIIVQAAVTGRSVTTLVARSWLSGQRKPAWQLVERDQAPGVLAKAGSVGFAAYQSSISGSGALALDSFDGWSATSGSTPPVTTSTSPAAPTTTARPAPRTSAKTSSAASSTPPAPTTSASTPATSSGDPNRTRSNAEPGAAPVGTTVYQPPARAIYVSAGNGSDSKGTGAIGRPLRTLAEAVHRSSSGSTIVLRRGTYHEDVMVPAGKRLTIQSYPREAVWLDGTSAVANWTRRGTSSVWVHNNWTAKFSATPGYDAASARAFPWVNRKLNPMAAHPDQVWISNVALRQVGSLSEVKAGTFYVDYSTSKLYVGSNPVHHDVRASDLAQALEVSSPNTTVRGIGIRRYATPLPLLGTVRLYARGDSVANVVVKDNASTGLDMSADDGAARHVTVLRNGLLGIRSTHAYRSSITKSVVSGNNSQEFNFAPVAGGIKTTTSRRVAVTGNVISNNIGNGLWFDQSCYALTVAGNSITNNRGRGVDLEISAVASVVDNTLSGNGHQGLFVEDTNGVSVWNNAFAHNGGAVYVHQDSRKNLASSGGHDPRRPKIDPTVPWIAKNVMIGNNAVQTGWPYLIFVSDATGKRTAGKMNVRIDGNLFDKPTDKSFAEIAWTIGVHRAARYTAAEFTAHGFGGSHNRDAANSGRSFSSSTKGSPIPLPAGMARIIGQAAGVRHIGTF